MAGQVGCSGIVKIGANAVAEITGWTLEDYVAKVAAPIAGPCRNRYLVGMGEVDGSINCIMDETDTNGQGSLTPGANVTLLLMHEGEGSGKPQRSVNAIIERVSERLDPSTPTARNFTFWSNDPVDRTAQT